MPLEELFQSLLADYFKAHAIATNKIGKAVNVQALTCDVEIDGEATMLEVRLQAVEENATSKMVIKPKEGSLVIVGVLENIKGEGFIVKCSEIEEVLINIETVEFKITAAGVSIKKGANSLKQALLDLANATQAITVTCTAPGTPSSVPLNIAAIQAASTKIQNILA